MLFESSLGWEEHVATARRLESEALVYLRTAATSTKSIPAGFTTLTRTERLVALYLKFGFSNKEIAQALRKSEPTVKNQVAAILCKLGVSSRARLTALLWWADRTASAVPLDFVVCGAPSASTGDGDHRSRRAADSLCRPACLSTGSLVTPSES